LTSGNILICDDEPAIRKTLAEILEDEGYGVEDVATGEALLDHLHRSDSRIDAILLDVWLPGMDGVETLEKIRGLGYRTPVIVISGHATLDAAVQATRLGAFDFLEKPLNLDKVILTLTNALERRRLEKRKHSLEAELPRVQMIGSGPAMRSLREQIELAAPSRGRVLILGESGSGKELAARLIHQQSDRREGPFIEMNCAAIPEELIESELFGHLKGSFTGASETRSGKFELADGGTLFLDEIADMSLNTQAKVLRVLQEQRFSPIGSGKTVHVDVRVIAATNKELETEIEAGRFRQDLFYRLNVIPVRMPPLRERVEDIPELCRHFIDSLSREHGREPPTLTEAAMTALQSYEWPGNIRELRNLTERMVIMTRGPEIDTGSLPEEVRGGNNGGFHFGNHASLREAREDFERRYIEWQLACHEGNITKTAEALGIERSNLHKKMKAYGI